MQMVLEGYSAVSITINLCFLSDGKEDRMEENESIYLFDSTVGYLCLMDVDGMEDGWNRIRPIRKHILLRGMVHRLAI